MLDYLTGKIIELIVYELQLHQTDIEAAVLELVGYMENKDGNDKAKDE
jgi:hypothetical protein